MAFPHALFRSEDGAGVTVHPLGSQTHTNPGETELPSDIQTHLEMQEDHPQSPEQEPRLHLPEFLKIPLKASCGDLAVKGM